MILLDDDITLITVYPMAHGVGAAHLSKSIDGGMTWSEGKLPNPTWAESRETPTIY